MYALIGYENIKVTLELGQSFGRDMREWKYNLSGLSETLISLNRSDGEQDSRPFETRPFRMSVIRMSTKVAFDSTQSWSESILKIRPFPYEHATYRVLLAG